MKTITLPCFDIVVEIDEEKFKGHILSSDLSNELTPMEANGIECLIIAHILAGIDVTAPAYIQGIESIMHWAMEENRDI